MKRAAVLLCAALLCPGFPRGLLEAQVMAPADPARTFLETTDPLLRERARRVLIGRGEEAAPVLQQALLSDNPRLREAAVHSLEGLAALEVEDWLARALQDEDRSVRIAAMKSLAQRGTDRLHPEVARAASDEHWAERRAAALVLSRTRVDAAVPLLANLAADCDRDVSEAALRGLLVSPSAAALAVLRDSYDAEDEDRAERILLRLAASNEEGDTPFFQQVLTARASDRLAILSAASLASRGVDLTSPPHSDFIIRCAASGDPQIRNPAVATLMRNRGPWGRIVLESLETADAQAAESLAELVVALLGPAARQPLLAIVSAGIPATDSARAAAVHALRRFRTAATTTELLWIYSVDLPRLMREEMCAAFEDLPRDAAARSGLVGLLEDPDSNLRLRSFRVLLQYGASTPEDIEWLLARIMEEKVSWVRQRMSRLLATYATGEGARKFAELMVIALDAPEPFSTDARDALENLKSASLRRGVAKAVLKRQQGPLSFSMLRLLTRLKGDEADRAVASALAAALEKGDEDEALRLLIALRAGGGPGTVAATREALASQSEILRTEALRTLLARGDELALESFSSLYDDLSGDQRSEFLGLIKGGDLQQVTPLLRTLLLREEDDYVRESIIERAGELKVPIADTLVTLLDGDRTPEFRIRVAEALASIGGDAAARAVHGLFDAQLRKTLAEGFSGPTDRLLLESLSRSVARTGQVELADELASLLLLRVAELEPLQYDRNAAFAFEVTILQALLDLAESSERLPEVAAAIEVEIDRAAESGDLYLLPKTLFQRLSNPIEKVSRSFFWEESLAPFHATLLDLLARLPPTADRQELPALLRLAEYATFERDHQRAVRLLEKALLLIEFHRVERWERYLHKSLSWPDPINGFDPLTRLRANIEVSRARAVRNLGAPAIERYSMAAAIAPFDAWLHLGIGGELREDDLDIDGARRHVQIAMELAPFDPDLLSRVARILAWTGDVDGFNAARAQFLELRACGLAQDKVIDRLGMAESLVQLGRQDQALIEIEAARALDPEIDERVRDNPLLAPLLDEQEE